MFNFEFSNNKTISRNTATYPITLETIKAKSFYFSQNPDDDTQDSYIENVLIPSVVLNWERNTKYLLLHHSINSYVPNIQSVNSFKLQIALSHLNVISVSAIYYYPSDWDEASDKTELDSENYFITDEVDNTPKNFRITQDQCYLAFYPIKNNLEVRYTAGFADNDFVSLDQEIIDCLSIQAAVAIDTKNGYCEDFYSEIIFQTYEKYSKEKQLITIL